MDEMFDQAWSTGMFPCIPELRDAIVRQINENVSEIMELTSESVVEDFINVITAAFYAGALYANDEGEAITVPITAEDSLTFMKKLIANSEAKITFYIEGEE